MLFSQLLKKTPENIGDEYLMAHELIDSPMKQKSANTENYIPNVCMNMNNPISDHRLCTNNTGTGRRPS